MSTALIVVDMQNLFVEGADPDRRVIAAVNERVAAAVDAGRPVFYTRDVGPTPHPPEGGTDLSRDLDVRGEVVPKGPGRRGGFSGFSLFPEEAGPGEGLLGPLAGLLRESGAEAVDVVGLAADVCVSATARDAVRLGWPATVDLEATAFVGAHPGGEKGAVADMRAGGVRVLAKSEDRAYGRGGPERRTRK